MKAVRGLIAALLALPPALLAAPPAPIPLPWLQLTQQYLNAQPIENVPPVGSLEDAVHAQQLFVSMLSRSLGPTIGYKAALTNPDAQKKFGIDHPVLGCLLQKMFIVDGSVVSTHAGARLMAEGDLIVRVRSDKINAAGTDLEILDGLDAVMPFLEIADLICSTNVEITAPILTALNAGARTGIPGKPIPLKANAEWLKRLGEFRVQIRDGENNVLGDGQGDAVLGHPIAAVRWIRDEVKARGGALKPGDLLSLGTLAPLVPVRPELALRVTYRGLDPDGGVVLTVSFKDQAPPPKRAVPPIDVISPDSAVP